MYPRTIKLTRPNTSTTMGAQDYASLENVGERTLFSDLPAEVQMQRRAGQPDGSVPTDGYSLMSFDIFIPAYALDKTARLQRGDIATDEMGVRYYLMGSYWNVLGWKLTTSIMET